jgi:hypothetical protein
MRASWEAWRDPIRVLIRVLQIQGVKPQPQRSAIQSRKSPSLEVTTRDGADDPVGLFRITGRWDPSSAVALHVLDGGQERAAPIAIRGVDGS